MKTSESAARTLGSLMQRVADVSGKMAKDVDLKRENANVDGDVAMGQMLRFGSETAKAYYLNYLIDPKFAEAHLNGDIHIHDLDFYAMTTTCCQIDLLKLLSKGFSTGHGSLREPQTIGSAAALTCIAIQSNQNDQHGGQSIPNFDYGLAPYVEKSFRRNYMDALIGAFEGALAGKNALHYVAGGVKHIFEDLESSGGVLSVDEDSCVMFCQTEELNFLVTTVGHCEISRQKVEELRDVAWNNATQKTYRETYQAMEALIHNLNTMHSRAGAQVPFSSINYGTDTSAAGRMVTECVLLALEAGLGNGETPIFPIHIFRVKEGVNFNEGDKNYDLFQLACKVSAKRLFPNFSFQDAPFNLRYYREDAPETEISYMGCVGKAEIVTYKINGELYVESVGRFWKRVAETNDVKTFGLSEYFDVDGVEIYDSSSDGFVKVRRLVKNPDKGDWTRVTFENGRALYLTEDHALPVEGKGRTLVRDMELGDAVPAAWSQYHIKDEEAMNFIPPDTAWALGVILCDGCYKSSLCVSLGLDERDVVDKFREVLKENLCLDSKIVERDRGSKGKYYDVKSVGEFARHRRWFASIFGGVNKIERHIPVDIFALTKECRVKFLCGMIDADGYVNKKHIVNLGSTNRELALQQAALAQSLGIPCKVYCNRYAKSKLNNIRYLVNFALTKEIWDSIVSSKKRNACSPRDKTTLTPPFLKLTKIEKLGALGESSYCVETESDRFDVSGINSHNCRTRVIGNVYDPENEIAFSRGNLSFTSINLPRLAIEFVTNRIQAATTEDAREIFAEDMKLQEEFVDEVLSKLDLCVEQLLERFALQSARTARNFPFLIQQGCWLDGEKLELDEQVGEILKHGTLSVGFIGLAETLTCLFGRHHGESLESQAFGLYLITKMRDALDARSQKAKLNFTLLATPAEGLSGRFVKLDRKKYGEIKGVTNKEYYTNSFHVPVDHPITINDKISLEAPYHELTNAGHITYVEVDGAISQNPQAFEKIVRRMKELGVGYGAINHPVDRDPICGYDGVIEDVCPRCGRKETQDQPFERIRRITGYLVGTLDRFNDAKRAEESQRVKHQSYGR